VFPDGGIDITEDQGGSFMARITVTTNPTERRSAPVLLDERICPEHLIDRSRHHYAAQLTERLGWAISNAAAAERAERTLQPIIYRGAA
jgi:hypothetical protein